MLGTYPIRIELHVAWGDMDALQHVNNTVYLRWFESARVAYFDAMMGTRSYPMTVVGPVLARQEMDYLLPLTYPETVIAETTTTQIGRTSLTMGFRLRRKVDNVLVAQGSAVAVMFDHQAGHKVPVPDELRQAIAALEERGYVGV